MDIITPLGTAQISDELLSALNVRPDAMCMRAECERIIRVAMQSTMKQQTVKERIAIAQYATEQIRILTGSRIWL